MEFRTDVLAAVIVNRARVFKVPRDFCDDRDIVTTAVMHTGSSLGFASPRLCDIDEVVRAAVSNKGDSLRYATERLRGDAEIVEVAVSNRGFALEFASPALRDDSRIVRLATRNYSPALEWASTRIKDDEEIVRPIVERDGEAFGHVSSRLRGDYPMIMIALEKTWKRPYSNPAMKARMEQTIRHVDINKLSVHLSSGPEGTFELMSLAARHCDIDDTYTLLREMNLSLFVSNLANTSEVPARKIRKNQGY